MTFEPLDDLSISDNCDNGASMRAIMALALVEVTFLAR